jgi:hypothetical protein
MAEIARIKVTLKGIRPPIWRRLEVPVEMSMARLSDVVLAAFGWSNSHLHEFAVGGRRIGMPDPDDWQPPLRLLDWPPADAALDLDLTGLPPLEDEATVDLVAALAGGLRKFTYTYDFGDDWKHLLAVEDVHAAEASHVYPRCIAGRRSAPPEDCGGVWGYEHLLEALADPGHEEHAELRERHPFFDPEEFDLAAADAALRNPPGYWE